MKQKSAFTLAELVMFFMVIAVLLSIIFATLKPQKILADKNVKHKYAAAYEALNLATYDMIIDENTDPFSKIDNDSKKGFKKLCTQLSEYLNTESVSCTKPIKNNVAYMKDENFDFRTIEPNLTALNGMKFYISELITDDVTPNTKRSYYNPENPDFTLKFYMVYADLNGKDDPNRPHSIAYDQKGKRHPSVHAFAVIPTGETIPIGIAEYNIKYLQTRVAYKENHALYYSPYYSLNQAKHAAWNWYKPNKSNIEFLEKISFTYNDYIKQILERHSSQIYKFNKDNAFPKTYDNDMLTKCKPVEAATVYDMCRITVDQLKFGSTH
ncbi:MAG: hypothetical protein K2F57_04270 [Candidatus Gastranaerophilales bacterium]|nr:hypothetical protein [Candidatus Gastranaerophilales bacterium]